MLYPLLRGDVFTAGARKTVHIGEKLVDWHDGFRPRQPPVGSAVPPPPRDGGAVRWGDTGSALLRRARI